MDWVLVKFLRLERNVVREPARSPREEDLVSDEQIELEAIP